MAERNVVVVTGCSSGIGLATAVLLARDGNFKVLATMRNLGKKNELEKAAGNTLDKTLFIQELDVSEEDSIMKFVTATFETEGHVDILINNAGLSQFGNFESVPMKQMQDLFQTNVFGTCKLTQEFVKDMRKRASGRVIFISSIRGAVAFPFSDFYVGSKHALEGIAGSMAPVLRQFNVFVTCVEPGPVHTETVPNASKNNQGAPAAPTGDKKLDALNLNLLKAEFSALKFQTATEIAEVVKRCIFMENPPLRLQSSQEVEDQVKLVLADHTGEKTTDRFIKMMGPQ